MNLKSRKFLVLGIVLLLAIITPLLALRTYNFLLEPPSKNSQETQIFVVTPGQPLVEIAQNLEKAGIIKNAFAFRILVGQMGITQSIQAGDFRLSPAKSSREIAQELTHGAIDVWVTLPEGLRVEEQAEKIYGALSFGKNENLNFDKKEFIELAQEGYMFPDTYLIPKDAYAKDIAERLRATFDEKVDKELLPAGKKYGLTQEEVLILASIIEREAKTDEEKPQIAGILLNRLDVGIALQVDATVQYAKGYSSTAKTWWTPVTVEEYTSIKSLYNTYLHPGLPPGPIANPGLSSIQAAANPKVTDYMYYLHDSDGKIHYAKTMEEHETNIQDFL